MKRLFVFLIAFCLICYTTCFASDAVRERIKLNETIGWSVFGSDDDIGNAAYETITELDTTYAQLAAEDQIEVTSASSADTTQTVTVKGIDSNGNQISESLLLTGTTVALSTATFRYIDQVSVDIECAGAITVQRETDTFIISIPVGSLEATIVQHFNGERDSYVTGWRASCTSTTGTLIFQLREYEDDADCLDAGDGFRVLDEIVFTNVLGTQNRPFPQPIKCSAGGWIVVYVIGGTDNADGSVTVQGYDVRI